MITRDAHNVHVSLCECDRVHVEFQDSKGRTFGTANYTVEGARELASNLVEAARVLSARIGKGDLLTLPVEGSA
jgi:hypothetical protein